MTDIISKIRKLLALAQSDNQNEAAAALAAAQRLMHQHKIAEAQISSGVELLEDELSEETVFEYKKTSAWKVRLLIILCDNNRCKAYRDVMEKKTDIRIFGRPGDVALVLSLYNWAVPKLEKMVPPKCQAARFLDGAVDAVKDALAKVVKETGIVLHDPEVEKFFLNRMDTKRPKTEVGMKGGAAYSRGYEAGKKLGIQGKAGGTKLLPKKAG